VLKQKDKKKWAQNMGLVYKYSSAIIFLHSAKWSWRFN